VDGNYNALRIWGPGSPLPEDFYQRADEKGILLWQDFFSVYTGSDPVQREGMR
jgi:beta-galactosidase/beta-glucuronidase